MKKVLRLLFVFGLLFALTTATAAAQADSTGSWQWDNPAAAGTEAAVDLAVTSAPAWEQVASTGLQLSAPANICYPFRSGQFHWVGEIRRLVDGQWLRLDTTVARPNSDADFQACARAPHAGTYALFAYYNGPAEGQAASALPECDFASTYGYVWGENYAYVKGDGPGITFKLFLYLPKSVGVGLPVTYSLNNIDPAGLITSGLSGSTTVMSMDDDINYALFADEMAFLFDEEGKGATFSAHFVLPTLGCYVDLDFPAFSK